MRHLNINFGKLRIRNSETVIVPNQHQNMCSALLEDTEKISNFDETVRNIMPLFLFGFDNYIPPVANLQILVSPTHSSQIEINIQTEQASEDREALIGDVHCLAERRDICFDSECWILYL